MEFSPLIVIIRFFVAIEETSYSSGDQGVSEKVVVRRLVKFGMGKSSDVIMMQILGDLFLVQNHMKLVLLLSQVLLFAHNRKCRLFFTKFFQRI